MNDTAQSRVRQRQDPLREKYRSDGKAAWSMKHARNIEDGGDPFHGSVEPGRGYNAAWRYGIDESVGGHQDLPNPGDMLCAALAACQESTLRMIADRLGIDIERLEVSVEGGVDVRGTLLVDEEVPVGFQTITCAVRLAPVGDTDPKKLRMLCAAAEHSCVVLQTLRNGVAVGLDFDTSSRNVAV